MPIGPITPGAFVTVTPDSPLPGIYASVQAPTATMTVSAAHIQALTLVVLNVQDYINSIKLDLAGGTMTGSLTLDNTTVPVGKLFTVSGTITVGGTANFNGTTNIGNGVGDAVTVIATTTVNSASKWIDKGMNFEKAPAYLSDADHTLDLATLNADSEKAQRIVMLTAPAANRTITLRQAAHADTPDDGYWFEITVLIGNGGNSVFIEREGATGGDLIATIVTGGSASDTATLRVQKVGGDWRGTTGGYLVRNGVDW